MFGLFTYGTLSDPEIMRAVTGRSFAARDAELPGYACLRVRGESYPGLLGSAGERATGRLYLGVDARSLERLDRFEGQLYDRRPLRVQTAGGARMVAFAYVVAPAQRSRLGSDPWDPHAFARDDRACFLQRCRLFYRREMVRERRISIASSKRPRS